MTAVTVSPRCHDRCWCQDRTLAQARKYIAEVMGERYAEGVILDLEQTWEESDPRTPLICFLSMGSDPTNNIEALAKKLKLECRAISMGQGQEVHARRLLQQSMSSVSGPHILDYTALYRIHCLYTSLVLHSAAFFEYDTDSLSTRVAGCYSRTATWASTSWRNYLKL